MGWEGLEPSTNALKGNDLIPAKRSQGKPLLTILSARLLRIAFDSDDVAEPRAPHSSGESV